MQNKLHIGNSFFSPAGFDRVLGLMESTIRMKSGKYFAAITNIHVMVLMEKDSELARVINCADISFCDSVSIVKLGKREGKIIPRCYGPDYVLRCSEFGIVHGWRHFFLGGSEGIADMLAEKLKQRFHGIQIAGTYCPPFKEMLKSEVDEMIAAINETKPDIVWVGLGAGKQDKWIDKYKDRINATWFSGVGAAFDFLSGNTRRAPPFVRMLGLEWLYRFVFEPKRLFFRNLKGAALLLKFLLRQTKQKWTRSNRI